jgi:hypothetical protein
MRRMDTFVVRVMGPLADGGEVEASLRGVVEHVGSGRSDKFRSADELVSFLRGPRGMPASAEDLPNGVETIE